MGETGRAQHWSEPLGVEIEIPLLSWNRIMAVLKIFADFGPAFSIGLGSSCLLLGVDIQTLYLDPSGLHSQSVDEDITACLC